MNGRSADNVVTSSGESVTLRANGHRENRWVWAVFFALLVLYVFSTLRMGPVSNFGIEGDDALYFASAKALATGQGYILPSFPIPLKATKYPELYPMLLAEVWKLDPHFPGNIMPAVGLTLAFGCLALLFAFLLLRRWPGLGDWQALAIIALCALSGYFLDLSASVMTDIPFMAVMLGAIWMTQSSTSAQARTPEAWKSSSWAAFGAGLLAGCSVCFRSLGMATVGGIGIVLLVRHSYRRALWFFLAAGPLVLMSFWPAVTAILRSSGTSLAVGSDSSGWTQTLCYYSSYACNWRMDISGPGALQAVLLSNLKGVIQQPGLYLLHPLATRPTLWSLVLVMLVSVAAYSGVARYVRKEGWQPLPITFLFYLLVVLAWPYTPDRFLVPFLPMFFGGLWLEGRYFVALVSEHLRSNHTFADRTIGVVLGLGCLALAGLVSANYAYAIPAKVEAMAREDRQVLAAERGAFDWIRNRTSLNDRVIARQDSLVYLYTGRRAIPAIAASTQAFYQKSPRLAARDAARLGDVARHVHASYWLISTVDTVLGGTGTGLMQAKQRHLLEGAPLVFQSADGTVRLYDVRCLTGAKKEGCDERAADAWGDVNAGRRPGTQ